MPLPPSVTKINKDGVQFISSVDRVSYTMKELCRAALRDVGKYVCREFRKAYYSHFKRAKGLVGKYSQYWVRYKYEDYPNLQVGIKNNPIDSGKSPAFYGLYQEIGSSRQPKLGLLSAAVEDNIEMIRKIESQYLSALENESEALGLISEDDYEGDGE